MSGISSNKNSAASHIQKSISTKNFIENATIINNTTNVTNLNIEIKNDLKLINNKSDIRVPAQPLPIFEERNYVVDNKPELSEVSTVYQMLAAREITSSNAQENLELIKSARRPNETLTEVAYSFLFLRSTEMLPSNAREDFKVVDKSLRLNELRNDATDDFVRLRQVEGSSLNARKDFELIDKSLSAKLKPETISINNIVPRPDSLEQTRADNTTQFIDIRKTTVRSSTAREIYKKLSK